MKKNLFETIHNQTVYKVPTQIKPINGTVQVPGSKSITNRALLLAALAKGKSTLTGVLFSDDSRHFLSSLESLGFDVDIDEPNTRVTVVGVDGNIPNKKATIDVGSAGTSSRFLTAMLALSDGDYTILCSEQMSKRPMKPLFDALITMGASFEYLDQEFHLPVRVVGNRGKCGDVSLDITKSTQFLSALLMVGPMTSTGFNINITSEKVSGAYINITRKMVEQFGSTTSFDGSTYQVPSNVHYNSQNYAIEPDMSAACYFYAMATLTGGSMTVIGVNEDFMQGDIKFLKVLEMLGSDIQSSPNGITVTGPKDGRYSGIDIDMNDFSDQTMTLACLAPYATSPTVIRHVAHIKVQECDRMQGIINELTRVGIECHDDGENIFIKPGNVQPASIQTYDDHRFAMSFTLLGLKSEGIIIEDPLCCKKTFEQYFIVLEELLDSNI